MIRQKTIEKYLQCLLVLWDQIENNPRVKITQLTRQMKISGNAKTELSKGGIIENTGSRRNPYWVWKSRRPDIKMAKELISRTMAAVAESNRRIIERGKQHEEVFSDGSNVDKMIHNSVKQINEMFVDGPIEVKSWSNWINIEEKFPDFGVDVLVYCKSCTSRNIVVSKLLRITWDENGKKMDWDTELWNITHWCKIPELPKKQIK